MENKFKTSLLKYFNINENQYQELIKDYDLVNFSGDHKFYNAKDAVELVNAAIKNKKRIIIYGDYDADGIMGTSILVKMFQKLNYHVDHYIPSRYFDGYGLNIENANKIIGKFDLVITVDNGIVANEPIQILRNNNIDVLVIDHHTPQLDLPNANVILHPEVSKYGDIATSGAYCAFIFSKEMLGYYDKYLATLASISLISDLMPLKEYNRNLLKAVFKNYQNEEFLPISLLAEHHHLNENVIGMTVAPKINAIGRMIEDKSINLVVKYFTSDDEEFILTYFNYMNSVNEQRKIISKEASNNIINNLNEDSLVSKLEIKEGLIGLIANAVMNKIKKPAIVFTKDNAGNLKGSARSVEGFNIVDAFKVLDKYMIHYGGHALAGGCEIKESDFEAFQKDFINIVNNSNIIPPEKEYIDLSITDLNFDNYNIYLSLSPFGEGWKAPEFILKHINVDSLSYSRNLDHILTKISNSTKLVGFNISKSNLIEHNYVNFIGRLTDSTYKNIRSLEFHINKYNFDN